MRYISALFISWFALVGQAQAWEELPLELFAAHSKFKEMVLSPDGKHIAFTYEEKDNEVKLAIITSDMKKITAAFGYGKDKHIIDPWWANSDRIVMRTIKNTGWLDDTKTRLYTVAANVDGRKRKRLFDDNRRSGYRFLDYLRSDPKHVLVGKTFFADKGGMKIHKMNVDNGTTEYIDAIPHATGKGRIVGVSVNTNEEITMAFERNPGDDKYDDDDDTFKFHYKKDGAWGVLNVVEDRKNAKYRPLGFNKENNKFYFISNMDMAKDDTRGVFSFDFDSKLIKLEFRHPDVDVMGGIFGPSNEVLGVSYLPGYPAKHYFEKKNIEADFLKSLSASFKGQNVSVTSYTTDGTKAIVRTSSDKNPGDFYLYDRSTGKLRYLASSLPDVKPKKMASVEAFTMSARDGTKLYGLLTLPKDLPAKNLPLIMLPHGGPHGPFDRWRFDREAQLFANRGYAVIQINFRGSGGYGEDFEKTGHRKWGREMQDDVTDATFWAIKEGIADKNRICLYGGSYGGYATLQGLVREPDLYKCGVGIAGVYSLELMWTGDSDMRYARNVKYSNIFLNDFIGKDKAELKAYSPTENVDKIKAAIFIIHGSKDVRVPLSHAELLRDNLDKIGKKYEWLVREEGHGFTQEKNRIDQYTQVLAFFEKHIGK